MGNTITLCFSGTDCWPDHALVPRPAEEIATYNPLSGYIPATLNRYLNHHSATSQSIPGCGTPFNAFAKTLPVDIWDQVKLSQEPEQTMPIKSSALPITGDSLTGHSINQLAAYAMSLLVGTRVQVLQSGLETTVVNAQPSADGDRVAAQIGLKGTDEIKPIIDGNARLYWRPTDLATISEPQRWDQINLVGHSRGGVVAIAVANLIALYLPHARVNVIGLDPVPGTGEWPENMCTLPRQNLGHYLGIYAVDETSAGFNAVVPAVKDTDARWDPLSQTLSDGNLSSDQYQLVFSRGRHATIPGSRISTGGDYNPKLISDLAGSVGKLVFFLCANRLQQWSGTGAAVPTTAHELEKLKSEIDKDGADKGGLFFTMRDHNYPVTGRFNDISWLPDFLSYKKARGVSSTPGRARFSIGLDGITWYWNYLEAFLPKEATLAQGFSGDIERETRTPHMRWQALTALENKADFGSQ